MANEGRIIDQKSPAELGLEPSGQRNYDGVNENNEVLASEDNNNTTRDTGKFSWSWLFGKFLNSLRQYNTLFTIDASSDPKTLVHKKYAAANETRLNNTHTFTFTEDDLGGYDAGQVLTGNITLDLTDAERGVTIQFKHNSPTIPTFSETVYWMLGSSYAVGADNDIVIRYTGNELRGWSTQSAPAFGSGTPTGGAVDGHTHSNLSVLNGIQQTNLLSAADRTKLDQMVVGYKNFHLTPVALNNAFPTPQPGWFAKVNSTNTIWVESGGAWVDSGGNDASVVLDAVQVKTLYESNANTNAFTDAEKAKVTLLDPSSYQNIPSLISANVTAANDKVYHNTANATYTDPTGVEGRGYIVRVLAGTATIGGIAYVPGDIVTRLYVSAAWVSRVYQEPAAPGGGGGGLTLIEEIEVTGSAVGIISFLSLDENDLEDDDVYFISLKAKHTNSSPRELNIRFNNDASPLSYVARNTTTQSATGLTARIRVNEGSANNFNNTYIKIMSPKLRPAYALSVNSNQNSTVPYSTFGTSPYTSDYGYIQSNPISSIQLLIDDFSLFVVGTTAKLYRGKSF